MFSLQATEDFKDMFIPILFTFFAFVLIFMFCEVGERFIAAFENIHGELWLNEWYTFPMEVQRKLPFLIDFLENPTMIRGVGNIQCTREDFKNVCIVKNCNNCKNCTLL